MDQPLTYQDPRDLTLHPLLRTAPGAWDDNDPRMEALVDDIRDRGVLEPILVTAGGEILDGRHRWRAAKRVGTPKIPCLRADVEDVAQVILSTLLCRRHYTPGQRAYLAAPFLTQAFDQAKVRRNSALKVGPVRNSVSNGNQKGSEIEDFARKLGVSVQYLRYATKLWDAWEKYAHRQFDFRESPDPLTLRGFFEPRILADDSPIGLGAAVAGVASVLEAADGRHGGGKPDRADAQLRLFTDTFSALSTRYEYWSGWDPETKRAALPKIEQAFEAMPDDLLDTMARTVRAEIARRKQDRP